MFPGLGRVALYGRCLMGSKSVTCVGCMCPSVVVESLLLLAHQWMGFTLRLTLTVRTGQTTACGLWSRCCPHRLESDPVHMVPSLTTLLFCWVWNQLCHALLWFEAGHRMFWFCGFLGWGVGFGASQGQLLPATGPGMPNRSYKTFWGDSCLCWIWRHVVGAVLKLKKGSHQSQA